MSEPSALDQLISVSESISNPFVETWKGEGKKVLAYNCSYMPEEIIAAAGLLPFRIKGTGCKETTQADSYLATVNCSFCRACLELHMQGQYDFLDGAIFVNACDHMHVTYANWKAQGKTPFMENIISVPNTITDYGQKWYREEIGNVKNKIEEHFLAEISDQNLKDAIGACNETRRLQGELYALMAGDKPPITGSQCLAVIVAGATMPKHDYNRLLKQLLDQLDGKQCVSGFKRRLMIGGSALDDPALIKIFEDLGGLVVADTLCFGSRFFKTPISEDGDPLHALADAHYHQIKCPRMFDSYDQRIEFARQIAKDSNADGVILQGIKNCDCHGIDNVMLERDLEKDGTPVLVLEREYDVMPDAGRIRTRAQAFMERMK